MLINLYKKDMAQTKWALDPSHSEVQFKVKHLMITTVTGYFKKFDASATTDGDDFTTGVIEFSADIDSIDTNSEQRDGHLKSADFFDAASHPKMVFSNGKLTGNDGEFTLNGDLTIRGVTKPVQLAVEFGGIATDPWGQTKAGFTLNGKIKRKDFGLAWDAVTEAGSVVVSDEVRINAEIQLVKQG